MLLYMGSFPSFREPVPSGEALDALCCWLDIGGSRLSWCWLLSA
jgi:hypothetical protein